MEAAALVQENVTAWIDCLTQLHARKAMFRVFEVRRSCDNPHGDGTLNYTEHLTEVYAQVSDLRIDDRRSLPASEFGVTKAKGGGRGVLCVGEKKRFLFTHRLLLVG